PDEVERRVDRVIASLRAGPGPAVVFAHGHVLRVLGARWVGLMSEDGSRLALDTATLGLLGYEREVPVLLVWNSPESVGALLGSASPHS
ncbi:MAG: histidine phosphatase family protein, partial [Acidimicrobiales bacterium]